MGSQVEQMLEVTKEKTRCHQVSLDIRANEKQIKPTNTSQHEAIFVQNNILKLKRSYSTFEENFSKRKNKQLLNYLTAQGGTTKAY